MSFRDDRDADQARIAALEAELGQARRQIDELEGRRSQALVLASTTTLGPTGAGKVPWYGAPMELVLTRRFTGELPREQFEDLIEPIRTITRDTGQTELLRSSMTWTARSNPRSTGPFTVVTVSVKDGATTLTVRDRLNQLAGALYGGIGGGVGGGAITLPIFASIAVPVLIPVIVLGWVGGVFFGTRALFKRAARRRAKVLQQLFDVLVDEIAPKLVPPPA